MVRRAELTLRNLPAGRVLRRLKRLDHQHAGCVVRFRRRETRTLSQAGQRPRGEQSISVRFADELSLLTRGCDVEVRLVAAACVADFVHVAEFLVRRRAW